MISNITETGLCLSWKNDCSSGLYGGDKILLFSTSQQGLKIMNWIFSSFLWADMSYCWQKRLKTSKGFCWKKGESRFSFSFMSCSLLWHRGMVPKSVPKLWSSFGGYVQLWWYWKKCVPILLVGRVLSRIPVRRCCSQWSIYQDQARYDSHHHHYHHRREQTSKSSFESYGRKQLLPMIKSKRSMFCSQGGKQDTLTQCLTIYFLYFELVHIERIKKKY